MRLEFVEGMSCGEVSNGMETREEGRGSEKGTYRIPPAVVGEEFAPARTECGEVPVPRRPPARVDRIEQGYVMQAEIGEIVLRDVEHRVALPVLHA
jgi:hypothetical protein